MPASLLAFLFGDIMSCDKETIKQLRDMADKMEKENKKSLKEEFEKDCITLLEETEIVVGFTYFGGTPEILRLSFYVPKESEFAKRFHEAFGDDGLTISYKEFDVQIGYTLRALRLNPYSYRGETNPIGKLCGKDKFNVHFLSVLPKINPSSIEHEIKNCEERISQQTNRLKTLRDLLTIAGH